MRARRTTRKGIRSVKNAFGTGTGSKFRLEVCDVGIAWRYAAYQSLPAADAGRYRAICSYDDIQLRYAPCGDRRLA